MASHLGLQTTFEAGNGILVCLGPGTGAKTCSSLNQKVAVVRERAQWLLRQPGEALQEENGSFHGRGWGVKPAWLRLVCLDPSDQSLSNKEGRDSQDRPCSRKPPVQRAECCTMLEGYREMESIAGSQSKLVIISKTRCRTEMLACYRNRYQ